MEPRDALSEVIFFSGCLASGRFGKPGEAVLHATGEMKEALQALRSSDIQEIQRSEWSYSLPKPKRIRGPVKLKVNCP